MGTEVMRETFEMYPLTGQLCTVCHGDRRATMNGTTCKNGHVADGYVPKKPNADIAPMWTKHEALQFCVEIENRISEIGFHVGLRGSVLFAGTSAHDLDLIIYPHDSTVCRTEELYSTLFCDMNMTRQKTVAQVHAGWRSRGSTDEKNVEIWTLGDRVVDIFYAGFDPYVGGL